MGESTTNEKNVVEPTKRDTIAFGFGALTDQMSHQAFQFLVFTFYYAVVGVNVNVLMWGFIIFAVWDSINDPLLGPISDRTQTRVGRRRFWVLVSLVPFALVNLFLFTPPLTGDEMTKAIYMILVVCLYDFFYTLFSINQVSMFSEMFKTEKKRSQANMYKNILTIIGILFGFVLPTVIIKPLAPEPGASIETIAIFGNKYMMTGFMLCILVFVFGFLFFKVGMKEDPTRMTKPQEMPSLLASLKETLKNKSFVIFVVANLFNWFSFKMLTTIIPLYGIHVLLIDEESFLLSLLLLVALLSAAVFFPICRKIGLKIGMRKAFMVTEGIWIGALIPFWFLDNQPVLALVFMIFIGIGLAGAMYYVDIIIGSIIDEAEVRTGRRREGSFYGINALIHRYSTILVFVVIAITLTGYGWDNYLVSGRNPTDIANLQMGLKELLVIWNIVGIAVVLVLLKVFPLHGERLRQVQEQLKAIHDRKASEKP